VLEVAFVQAPRQSLFFGELQEGLADALETQDVTTSVHLGAFPPPRPGLVYALVAPREHFMLMHGRIAPPPEVHARTMYICTEQPGTSLFQWNMAYGGRAGAVFHIDRLAVRNLREAGVDARHLPLGHSPRWDFLPERMGGDGQRDIDVLFIGTGSDRRLRFLGSCAAALGHRRCYWVISDDSLPSSRASRSYVAGEAKWDLLGRAKVLINLHETEAPYFEWLRVVQAMANGAVVVSERSVDTDPLVPGEHLLVGRPESLGHLAERLLADTRRCREMQTAAYHVVRDELPMSKAGALLAEAARRLDQRPVPAAVNGFFLQPPASDADAEAALEPSSPPETGDPTPRILKDLRLGLLDLRRRLDGLSARLDDAAAPAALVHRRSSGWTAARPSISVLVTVYNYADHVIGALDSLLKSTRRAWEVVVVDDASSDDSVARVARWMADHPTVSALLVRHPTNRGLAHARNAALDFARGDLCFILDADNEVLPWTFARLTAALETDPAAAFAYGMLERFSRSGVVGLSGVFPWQPERFREGNYIDAMALMRTRVLRDLGGYRTDPRLYGWEDFDLWARMAERGLHAVHVPSVVARYRTTDHSMLSITNISGAEATSMIAEASPTVMAGARIPE
jgi:hypothetical protein